MFTADEHIAERQAGNEKGVGDVCSGKKRGGRKVTLEIFWFCMWQEVSSVIV